ncbi:MAG: hypothetical protein IKC03_00370, partial [Oscillospiraceae bacterium]|nr:hypothetical protein [Oscillospiraceae bacterium]
MKKNMNKIVSLVLALSLCMCMGVTAFAAEIDTSGGAGSTPVSLSSTDDGTLGGNPAGTAMSVTVPTALPMAMAQNGDVTTATDCRIVNNSFGAVRVASVSITADNGWNLTAFGDKSTLANEKVDSNKFGFALSIGGGSQVVTDNSDESAQNLISAPITGCYLSGAGNPAGNSVAVQYDAIVTPLSAPVTNSTIANVVFVIEWDTAE